LHRRELERLRFFCWKGEKVIAREERVRLSQKLKKPDKNLSKKIRLKKIAGRVRGGGGESGDGMPPGEEK